MAERSVAPASGRIAFALLAVMPLLQNPFPARGQVCPINEVDKFTGSDVSEFDEFARSVSVSGDRVVVGSALDDDVADNSGSAFVFRRDDNGTPLDPCDDSWVQEAKLKASDAAYQDRFGVSVAISGDRIVVGAYLDDGDAANSGSAYVFRRDDSGTPTDASDDFWVEEAKLIASDGAGREFGWSVSVSGDRIVVGGFFSESAYVFRRDDNATPSNPTDDSWLDEAKLIASDVSAGDSFGNSVSIRGDLLVVGAEFDQVAGLPAGSAYVFRRNDNGTQQDPTDDSWTQAAKLNPSDANTFDRFGSSVSSGADHVFVGAFQDDENGMNSGAAYVFRRADNNTPSDPNDDFWVQETKLTASDGGAGNGFGFSVSHDGGRALIGAPWQPNCPGYLLPCDVGAAYFFRRDDKGTPFDPSDDLWLEESKLRASDSTVGSGFGWSVSVAGARADVGASASFPVRGSAYTFTLSGADEAADCNGNGIPDACEPDCNANGVADECDVADGTSEDCHGNGNCIPDECEPDCNGNGAADSCDVAMGTSADCNLNAVPDECDIAGGTSRDDKGNGVPDECEFRPELSWVPVGADGPFSFGAGTDQAEAPTQILLLEGSPHQVEFEVRINGWGFLPFASTLALYQARLDASGLLGENAMPPNPGTDLVQTDAFVAANRCTDPAGTPCESDTDCPGTGVSCEVNPDFVFAGKSAMAGFIGTTWVAYLRAGDFKEDDRASSFYAGTLMLDVPMSARGTYTLDFDPAIANTFLKNVTGDDLPGLIRTPGQIVIGGSCCMPDGSCEFLTEADCLLASGTPTGGLCDVHPPLSAPYPHDRRKNRYISFDPNKALNDGIDIAFKVDLKEISLGSCGGNGGFCRIGHGADECHTCSGSGAPCLTAPIDCPPGESCDPTGAICLNDAPNVGGTNVGRVWWVGPESPLGNGVHLMVSKPFRKVSTDWPNPTHVGDCEIVPEAVYGIRAVNMASGGESGKLLVETTLFATGSSSWWGDCVGPLKKFCGGDIRTAECAGSAECTPPFTCDPAWTLPDGSVNFDDVNAALALVAPGATSVPPHTTWVDLHGNATGTPGTQNYDPPNFVLNFSDIAQIIFGFQGLPYKGFDPAECPDVPNWP